MKKLTITKVLNKSTTQEQAHGNYCLHAELSNGSLIYVHNVRYKATTVSITYKPGKVKTFSLNGLLNGMYSEVIKQYYSNFEEYSNN